MKKVLLIFLSFILLFSLVSCNENEIKNKESKNTEQLPNIANNNVKTTDEKTVTTALEQFFKNIYGSIVEEVVPKNIKVYSQEEISSNEKLRGYTINEDDIVFEAIYDLKIVEGYENINVFTSDNGTLDGQWIRNKYNVGIARYNDGTYSSIEAFGTAF